MKILIAVPCMDQVPAQFAQSLAVLNKVEECAVAFQMGSLIYTSRNDLAKMAIQNECDYVLWLDSDMVFAPDTLKKLLENRDKADIITGIYYRRVSPYTPVLFDHLEIDGQKCTWNNIDKLPDTNDLFDIEGCGFGCVLTPTSVFLNVIEKFGNMFAPIGNVGEDLSFCWRARQCGYTIKADPRVKCGHVGHYIIDKKFYDVFANEKGKKHES